MDPAVAQIAKRQAQTYFGKYRGFVDDNADPDMLGRLRLRVPSIFGETVSAWALPCLPLGGLADQGLFLLPEIGAQVWVEFEEGNRDKPIWTGTFWRTSDPPPSEAQLAEPTTRILKTASGHILQFDDADGEERIALAHQNGAILEMKPDGNVALTDQGGSTLTLDNAGGALVLEDAGGNTLTMDASGTVIEDKNGNKVEMAPAGITVKGTTITIEGQSVSVGGAGGEPLIKGMSFLSLFMTHMHTCTAPGTPSSPPIPQGEMSTLTTKTTAS